MFKFLKALNTHNIAHLGLVLVGFAGVLASPPVHPLVALLPAPAQAAVHVGVGLMVGVGTLLSYLGMPATIQAGPPPAPPQK